MEYIADNYAQLAPRVYRDIAQHGIAGPSRNGNVLRLPGVTTFTVTKPWQRVNFSPDRDANPFFHLVEAMAMLANYNSVFLMSYLAKNMASFSDDGIRYNAFYGTRMRRRFGFDQLLAVIKELSTNLESRQCVVQIWDPEDLHRPTKDKACNLCLIFDVVDGKLNMTSFNRSNDAIWGIVTGANVVHLSFFHEYVACALGIGMGSWSHSTANLHVYTDNPLWEKLKTGPDQKDVYGSAVVPFTGDLLFDHPDERAALDEALPNLMCLMEGMAMDATPSAQLRHIFFPAAASWDSMPRFLKRTVLPAFEAWCARKNGDAARCRSHIGMIESLDWRLACMLWVDRRDAK